jgi:hypothetical protein
MKLPKVKRPSKEVLAKVHSLKKEKGKIAVIEPDSGEYFLGKTLLEALKKAEAKYPNKIFYAIRIGYPFAHQLKGGIRKNGISLFNRVRVDFQPKEKHCKIGQVTFPKNTNVTPKPWQELLS